MAKPSDTYDWAGNVGATVDPGSIRKGSGFVAGKKAPAKWFNWLHRGASLWHAYLDNLHNEAEFLGQDYAWQGHHVFYEEVDFNNQRPYAKWLDLEKGRARGTDSTIFYDPNGDGGDMPRWTWTGGSTDVSFVAFPLDLPSGAVVTSVKAAINASTGDTVRGRLGRWTQNQLTGARTFGAGSIMRRIGGDGSSSVAATAGLHLYTLDALTGADQTVDRALGNLQLRLSVQAGVALTESFLTGIRVEYTLPGYRNG